MAYSDVFKACSIVAFALVPLCFMLSPIKGGRGGGGGPLGSAAAEAQGTHRTTNSADRAKRRSVAR